MPLCCCKKQRNNKNDLRKTLIIKNNVCPHCLARFNTKNEKESHMKFCIYRPVNKDQL